jgi:hypothetical protein
MASKKRPSKAKPEEVQYFTASGGTMAVPKWWTLDPDKDEKGHATAEAVSASLGLMRQYQERRVGQAVFNARLYGNLALTSAFGVVFSELQTANATAPTSRLTYNVIQSCVTRWSRASPRA